MNSDTPERLLIIYNNSFLPKKVFFFLCKEFYIDLWSLEIPNGSPFWLYFDGTFCYFFKCSPNFKVHALQSELNKVGHINFVKFRLQSMSSKIEKECEKRTNYFLSSFCQFQLQDPFPALSPTFFYILYPKSLLILCDEYNSKTVIKL